MKKLSIYILLLVLSYSASAQDLNARVKFIRGKIKTSNTHIFHSLETAMKDFLNVRKWRAPIICCLQERGRLQLCIEPVQLGRQQQFPAASC